MTEHTHFTQLNLLHCVCIQTYECMLRKPATTVRYLTTDSMILHRLCEAMTKHLAISTERVC